MKEIAKEKDATIEGRNYEKSALSGSTYKSEDGVIMGFVLRAEICRSRDQRVPDAGPVIEVD